MRNRPSWDEYFLMIARTVSTRSHDEETQVGCVIVNERNHIVGTGYNGFPSGATDGSLPATRPEKYPYMIHSEANAIANSTQNLFGCTLYCTLQPCLECMKLIKSSGIKRVVMAERREPSKENELAYRIHSLDIEFIEIII